MITAHRYLAAAIISAIPSAGHGSDWFAFDRVEALKKVRAAVEKMEKIAPIPDLTCKPNPNILRYCTGDLSKRVSFRIVETFADIAKIADFQKGGPGFVHELGAYIKLEDASDTELEMFDTLCTASVMALRPKLGHQAAFRRYSAALRRSVNKSMTKDNTEVVVGDPDTLLVTASSFDASCNVTAEDDYRLK